MDGGVGGGDEEPGTVSRARPAASGPLEGWSIKALAAELGINRTTVMSQLERRGIERRRIVRKMTDRSVRQPALVYDEGQSLKTVAAQFDVDARTLAREFRAAAYPTRPRRGWTG